MMLYENILAGGGSGSGSGSVSRAVLTYLRGCVRAGAVQQAMDLEAKMSQEAVKTESAVGAASPSAAATAAAGFTPGARSQLATLLCQALNMDAAEEAAASVGVTSPGALAAAHESGGAAEDSAGAAIETATAVVRVAQAHALLGRPVPASQWARRASSLLQSGQDSELLQAMRGHRKDVASATTSSSAERFRRHQRETLQQELDVVDACVRATVAGNGGAGVAQQQHHERSRTTAYHERARTTAYHERARTTAWM